ncbi:MAG: type II toxin-antitoxin system Phd/YefM family antitoxin [Elusimicrobiota bacterium]
MKHISAERFRRELSNVIRVAIKTHEPVVVSSTRGDVVVISKEDFEGILESLTLLSAPGIVAGIRRAKKDVAAGRTYSMTEVFGFNRN